MSELRVHNFSISLDGYVAGPGQDLEHPQGVGGEQLHEWVFSDAATKGIRAALDRARAAAGDADVRLGGGAATVRQYIQAGLLDEVHSPSSPSCSGAASGCSGTWGRPSTTGRPSSSPPRPRSPTCGCAEVTRCARALFDTMGA
jgi:hypothetical protein